MTAASAACTLAGALGRDQPAPDIAHQQGDVRPAA